MRDEARRHHARRRPGPARSSSTTRSSASSRAPTSCSACVRWQLAKRQAGTHKAKSRSRSTARPRRSTSRRAPAARHGARERRSSAAAAVPSARSVRSHAHDLPKKVRALALKHALSAKAKDGAHRDRRRARSTRARPRPCRALRQARLANALIIDGAEVDANFARRAQHPEHRRAAGAGHQRLRHPAPRQARADQGRRRSAGGALQMSLDPRHYDVIRQPGHHREGDHGLRAQPGRVQGARWTRPSRRSRRRSRRCSTSR